MRRLTTIALLLATVWLGFAPNAAAVTARTDEEVATRDRIIQLTNYQRSRFGKSALTQLLYASQQQYLHANYMADKGRISHDNLSTRAARVNTRVGISRYCENVAFISQSGLNFRTAAYKFVNLWMNSPPHRRCILDQTGLGGMNQIGVGVERRGNTWYAAMLLVHNKPNDPEN